MPAFADRRAFLLGILSAACTAPGARKPGGAPPPNAAASHDLVIRGGLLFDGSGGEPVRGDLGIQGDAISAISAPGTLRGAETLDASGLAVAPGFVNMLSWATESLLVDGRGESDVRQGVTLEVFGEGWSMGPLNAKMKKEMREQQGDLRFDITWTSLADYLSLLERKGVAVNVASYVGATTVRIHELDYADRPPTPAELARMKALVATAMSEGALGVGSSLIYAPAFYAKTDELVALCEAAARFGGGYITHMRSEGNRLLEGIDEVVEIARRANVKAEIYHLKAAGRANWAKLDAVVSRIEKARAEGLRLTADMYTYTAGATGLDASMPPWVQEGGLQAWVARLKDPAIRERVTREMRTPTDSWENLLLSAGSPERVLLVGFKSDRLKPLTGLTLAKVASERGKSPEETAIDLVVEDDSRVEAVYFLMSEENVRRQVALPWVAFGSDEGAPSPEGVFLKRNAHPRAYGNVARLLGRYVRDEKLVSLPEAVRRLSSFPADNLGLARRGRLLVGHLADVAVFDAAAIADHATYEKPHQLATGMVHVLVNGKPVLKDGKMTAARPGRFVRGPGYRGRS